VLWDKAGSDRYFGDTFTQGAGCFGVGILRDDAGNDSYQAALFAQGFGFEPSFIHTMMREGEIPSLCERGVDEDWGAIG
jgi:hypothetical protein